jgi:hypothetical protein
MAIDLNAIRRKLGELSGKNNKRDQQWKPEEGKEYTVRLISFPNNDGLPFKDRYYYWLGKNGILAPHQFGKPDPIRELRNKLYDENTDASKDLAKKFAPKLRTFAPVIVRGEEDKGVRIWSFGKMVYQSLLEFITNEDYGDVTDPIEGRDIKVQMVKMPGKQYADTKVTPRVKTEPLSRDPSLVKKWMESIPVVDEIADLKSYEDIEKMVNDWINGGMGDNSEGTQRGGSTTSSKTDEAPAKSNAGKDKLAAFSDDEDDSFTSAAPAKPAASVKKNNRKTAEQDLNDAFAELENV